MLRSAGLRIGNHVIIAPHSVIPDDVPANTRVDILNQLRIGKSAGPRISARMRVVGAGVVGNAIPVLGDGFSTLTDARATV
jgi:DNA-directed RNA polymerase subunit H (RpoH/RPB5)